MIKRIVKLGNNTHQNFKISADISYWANRYHISIDEIQKIFNDSGSSISKTLEVLKQRERPL
jgi:hypothetical protein